ncbi:MAG TPA: lipase family protein [Sphingorhabdus sp.]|jgi:acetyl esterase/lipase|nr:lipase family protein [Sphingorhabdus sp.]
MRLFSLLLLAILLFAGSPAKAQQAGMLLVQEQVSNAPASMKAWRIRYWSTSDGGAPEQMTGMVIAPDDPPSRMGRPVLAWAHGTWGISDKCTPSQAPTFFTSTPALAEMVGRGYVVVAPDYAGLGTAQIHPYLVGTSAAHSVLDAVRASRAIAEAGATSRFAVWGESQGGHAALWTGQLARSYAPDLTLTGVAAAAPPTDLIENLTGGTDPSVRAFLTAFTAHSWSKHFGISLRTLGSKSTGDLIDRLGRNNCVTLGAKPRIGTMVGVAILRTRLKNVDLGRISPWKDIARDNSPAPRDYGIPFLIAQNDGDAIVAPDVTREFVRKLCRDRARLRFIAINSKGGHPTSAADSATQTLDWIDARFAGEPAPSDCRSF